MVDVNTVAAAIVSISVKTSIKQQQQNQRTTFNGHDMVTAIMQSKRY